MSQQVVLQWCGRVSAALSGAGWRTPPWEEPPCGGSCLCGSHGKPSFQAKGCIPPGELFTGECRGDSPRPSGVDTMDCVLWTQ